MTSLWLVFALMTAAAILAVLWPLSRRGRVGGGTEVAVYRDQLGEIARDRKAGLIGEAEAEAARIEVSRRLLAAAETEKHEPPVGSSIWRRRATAVVALVLVPAGAVAVYLALGSPQLPGEPLAARLQDLHQNDSIVKMITQVEAHLEANPNDARGWQVLAPVYMRLGRYDQAVIANRKLIALQGENAEREADLGEALTAAANGVVTDDAKSAFQRAAQLDASDVKAQFFLGMAAQQDGNKKEAAAIWNALLAKAPADAPWIETVRDALKQIGEAPAAVASAPAAGPSAEQMAAAGQMSDADRNEMIRGMVARLAERLKDNGNDVEGWQRLMRAYVVLGERDKAHAAAADAKRALAGDPGKLHQIEDVIKTLGLES